MKFSFPKKLQNNLVQALEKFYFDVVCEMKNTLHINPHSSTKFWDHVQFLK